MPRKTSREVAREEVASLCGLVLRRLDKLNGATDVQEVQAALFSIFGEALRDFSGEDSPGPEAQ